MRMLRVDADLARLHYAEHEGKPFFPLLIDYITSGPIIALCLEGNDAIASLRNIVGNTNPVKAAAGTIRGDYALTIGRNLIHAADSPEAAERELALFFSPKDIIEHTPALHSWIHRED
jgi:nucleoside-diphosphate kinase